MKALTQILISILIVASASAQTTPINNPKIQGSSGTIISGATLTNNGTFTNADTLNGNGTFNLSGGTVTLPATVGGLASWPGTTGITTLGTITTGVWNGTAIGVSYGGSGQSSLAASAQAFLDSISTTQGTLLYNNGTDWVSLAPGTSGHFLKTLGAGANPVWAAGGSGIGDVVGPASSVTNRIALFDGTTGKLIKDSGALLSDYLTTANAATTYAPLVSPSFTTPALGTPSSGVVTNLTGTASININGTVGATTPSTGAFSSVVINGATLTAEVPNVATTAATTNYLGVKTTGTGANIAAGIMMENSTSQALLFKAGTGYGTYKTITSNDVGFYNNSIGGNISILNDYTSGNVNFAAGGSSTAHLTIASTGVVNVANLTTNGVVTATSGNGTLTTVAPGTNGNVLTSNGTSWTSVAPAGGGLTIGTTAITGGTSGRLLTSGTTVGELTLGTGVSTFLGTPTLANFNTALSDADVATTGANTFTGVQRLPAGTAAAPALNFGDTGTGLYRSGTNEIAFSTNGTQRFYINAAGGLFHTGTNSWFPFPADGNFYLGGPIVVRQSNGGTNFIKLDAGTSTSTSQYIGWFVGGFLTLSLYYEADAKLQIGADTATNGATAIAQTFKGPDATGTTSTGGSLTLAGGTGTSAGGAVIISTAATTTQTERARFSSAGVTIGASGTAIASVISNTATLDFPSTSSHDASALTITVTGAAVGDVVAIGIPNGSVGTTGVFFGWVSAADTVTIRYCNTHNGGAVDPASGTFRATVIKH